MLNIVLNDITLPKLFVGDSKQAIYEWKGSINAFENLPKNNTTTIELYTTFRMGQPACKWISKETKSWITPYDDTKVTNVYTEQSDEFKTNKDNSFVYIFRTWKGLLQTAQKTKNIWIYDYNKKIVAIRKLHEKLQHFTLTDEEKGEFEDDLPAFLMNLSKSELVQLEKDINNNLESSEESANCKMYTIHSYKGMENDNIKIYNDIDIKNEPNLYYVALTRGINNIFIENNKVENNSIFIDTSYKIMSEDNQKKMH